MLTRLYLVATFIRVGKQAGCHAFLEFNGQKKLLVFFWTTTPEMCDRKIENRLVSTNRGLMTTSLFVG